MDQNRRMFAAGGACSLLLPLAGCSTSSRSTTVRQQYDETVSSVLIAPQSSQLVVLGEKYHYIFDDVKQLNAVLGSSFRQQLQGLFDPFNVYEQNRIRGSYRLTTNSPLSPEQQREAVSLGFVEKKNGIFELNGHLNGKRYAPSDVGSNGRASALNRTYVVKVDETVAPNANRPPPQTSPVKKAADGVLTILLIPLVVLLVFALGAPR